VTAIVGVALKSIAAGLNQFLKKLPANPVAARPADAEEGDEVALFSGLPQDTPRDRTVPPSHSPVKNQAATFAAST